MYKELFENKKAAIFDLETIILGIRDIHLETFTEVLKNLQVDWIYLPSVIEEGDTVEQVWASILRDPYINIKIPLEQLLNTTNTKLRDIVEVKTDLSLLPGFWEFADELKNKYQFKLVLKSEFNSSITQSLIKTLELEGIFDLVVVHSGEKTKSDLYKEILNILKKHKITNKECISFERSPQRCLESTSRDIITVAIKEDNIPGDDFPYKVTEYHKDFTSFPGNIDKTYLQTFEEAHSWKK